MTLGESLVVNGLPFLLTGLAVGLAYLTQVSWKRRRG